MKKSLQLFIKNLFLNILGHNRIEGVPELVRDTSVDHRSEFHFGLVFRVQDMVCYVNDLYHFHEPAVAIKLLGFELNIVLALKVLT